MKRLTITLTALVMGILSMSSVVSAREICRCPDGTIRSREADGHCPCPSTQCKCPPGQVSYPRGGGRCSPCIPISKLT